MKPGPRPWCRLWGDWIDDHRIQILSEVDQRRHVALMCLHTRGIAPCTDELVAFKLRISTDEWKRTKDVFMAAGIVDERNGLLAWSRRQFESDSSADRVKAFRERHRNNGETLQKRSSNADVTHSENREQRTEKKDISSSADDSASTEKARKLVASWNGFAELAGMRTCKATTAQLKQLVKRQKADATFDETVREAIDTLTMRGVEEFYRKFGLFNVIRPDNLSKIIDGGWSPPEDPDDVEPQGGWTNEQELKQKPL